jgi:hypothetical protein
MVRAIVTGNVLVGGAAFVMAIMRSVFKVFDVDYFFIFDGCLRLLCVFFISVLS